MPPAVVAGIGLAITAASAGFSAMQQIKQSKQAKKRRKAEEEAQRVAQVRADVEARKERRKQLREARIRRAQVIQANINSGGGISSSVTQGAIGGINTQFGSNIGAINESQGFSRRISTANEQAASAQSKINQAQSNIQVSNTIGNVGSGIFDRGGGFTTLFGGNKTGA